MLYFSEDSCIYLINNYFDDFKNNFILNVYIISGSNGKEILFHKLYNYNNIKGDEIIKIDEIKNDNYKNVYITFLIFICLL